MNYMTTETPSTPRERLGDWAQKAWLSGYDFITGPKEKSLRFSWNEATADFPDITDPNEPELI